MAYSHFYLCKYFIIMLIKHTAYGDWNRNVIEFSASCFVLVLNCFY